MDATMTRMLTSAPDGFAVRLSRVVPAPVDDVWSA